jgi:hypothetical protein
VSGKARWGLQGSSDSDGRAFDAIEAIDGQTSPGHAVRHALYGAVRDELVRRAVKAADEAHQAEVDRLYRCLRMAVPERDEDWHGRPEDLLYLRRVAGLA